MAVPETSIFDWEAEEKAYPINGEINLKEFENWFKDHGYREPYKNDDRLGIAVIMFDGIGDAILASCAIQHIKDNYPNSYVHLFCTDSIAELYAACPHTDQITPFPNKIKELSALNPLLLPKAASKIIKNRKIHIAYVFSFFSPAYRFAFLLGAKDRYALLPDTELLSSGNINTFISSANLYVTRFTTHGNENIARTFNRMVSKKISTKEPLSVYIQPKDMIEIDKIVSEELSSYNELIAVGVTSGVIGKTYPMMLEALDLLHQKYPSKHFILLGRDPLCDLSEYKVDYATSYVDKLSIPETIALLSKCESLISNDTWLIHAASAMEIPCIDIVAYAAKKKLKNYSVPIAFAPYNTKHVIVQPADVGDRKCLKYKHHAGCCHIVETNSCCIAHIDPTVIVKAYTTLLSVKDNKSVFVH